ncbi:MAG: DUF2029 domain-containing protein [Syntrophobacterales bacterium]|jgi:hypothetical protein|nr:DUF2029 domain-containing protein [Syntrophobacterales bacterium]
MNFTSSINYRRIFLTIILIFIISFNFLWALRNDKLRDFGSFIASGRASLERLNPYDYNYPLVFWPKLQKLGLSVPSPNLNPPISILIIKPFASFNPHKSILVWRIISTLFYTLAIIMLVKAFQNYSSFERILWAFSLSGFWHIIELGQIQTLLLLICVCAWLSFKLKNEISAGLLIGIVVAIKPNFAVWILFLFLGKYRKEAIVAFITAAIISILPLVLYGTDIYYQWLEAVSNFKGITMIGNSSFMGMTARFGFLWIGELMGVALILSLGYWIWTTQLQALEISALAIITSLLAAPIAWGTYTIMVLPILFERKWNIIVIVSSILLIIPFFILIILSSISRLNFILIGWSYGWSLVLILIAVIKEIRQGHMPLGNPTYNTKRGN